ncbi:uncharacterized protein TNCV_4429031 [Trichonephila clavipes]|nr:uncharacterized protein TNCV_4429031 [Trichonephila clavipes]
MRTTPELSSPSPKDHTASTGGQYTSISLACIIPSSRRIFSGTRAAIHDTYGHEQDRLKAWANWSETQGLGHNGGLVSFSHQPYLGRVTRTTLELAPHSPNLHFTPIGGLSTMTDSMYIKPSTRRSSVASGFEPKTQQRRARCLCGMGGTLNSRRAASPLVCLVEGEERWEAPGHPQGFRSKNWGGTEQNLSATCMVLKAKANDRRKNSSP